MTDLIPYTPSNAAPPDLEHVNLLVAMAGLSVHTQRAYQRWIKRYLAEIHGIAAETLDLRALPVALAVESLATANLKAWLGRLKAEGLGKQSIMQAKAAVVWLAQLMADMERIEYAVASGLSRVKAPRAESGQRSGTWLSPDEIRAMLNKLRNTATHNPALRARNVAIITLMVTCGLRRDEVAAALWSDLTRQGRNQILKVHGKGEKMRPIKVA
jgi:site-specific recombinase XerC